MVVRLHSHREVLVLLRGDDLLPPIQMEGVLVLRHECLGLAPQLIHPLEDEKEWYDPEVLYGLQVDQALGHGLPDQVQYLECSFILHHEHVDVVGGL